MSESIKRSTSVGSIIAYGIAIAFFALAIFFSMSASSQEQAFISSELGVATLSPNGPSGGMLVPASGCSGVEGGCPPPCSGMEGGCPTPGTWNVGPWGSCNRTACGTVGTQYRTVTCTSFYGCSGTKPFTSRNCYNDPCPLGTWQTGPWGSCSGACGTNGTQYRTVTCPSAAGCSGSPPASSQSCTNAACAPLGTWQTGPWSSCSGACGTTGTQTRTVTCPSAAGCSGTEPASSQSCTNAACPLGTWQTGPWGSCSGACGTTGTQTRTVTCPSVYGCSGPAPASSQSCTSAACPPTVNLSAQILPGTTSYTSPSIYITPADDLRLTWTSNAVSCTKSFVGGTASSDSHDVTPNLDPGGSRLYTVTCENSAGDTASDSIIARVPNILVNTLEINPSVVRSGEKAMVEWNLRLDDSLTATPSGVFTPYSYSCEINGAIPSQPYIFDAADSSGNGSVETRVLTSQSIAALRCSTFVQDSATVEVVPSFEEI